MKNDWIVNTILTLLILGLVLSIFFSGCATRKKTIEPDRPGPVVYYEPEYNEYHVRPGDCLWDISYREYRDAFLWWTIYEKNRDQIGDNPDLIEINQTFMLKKKFTGLDLIYSRLKTKKWDEY